MNVFICHLETCHAWCDVSVLQLPTCDRITSEECYCRRMNSHINDTGRRGYRYISHFLYFFPFLSLQQTHSTIRLSENFILTLIILFIGQIVASVVTFVPKHRKYSICTLITYFFDGKGTSFPVVFVNKMFLCQTQKRTNRPEKEKL